MKELKIINPQNASEEEIRGYRVREASRAVVVDRDGKVVLLHVSKYNYYKLPGGGLEGSEDKIAALKRECREEIGCEIEVLYELGSIIEYRKMFELKQISYCYLAKVTGDKSSTNFTEDEIKDGFGEVWMSYEDAVKELVESKATNIEGREFIVPRDTLLLKEAEQYLVDLY